MPTPEQLAERLGLQDFDTFALKSRWHMASLRLQSRYDIPVTEVMNRRQGKSTRNVLAALCRLLDPDAKQVLIVAHSKRMQETLVKQAGDWALELGIDPRRIKGAAARSGYEVGRDPQDVFVDHVVHEFPQAV